MKIVKRQVQKQVARCYKQKWGYTKKAIHWCLREYQDYALGPSALGHLNLVVPSTPVHNLLLVFLLCSKCRSQYLCFFYKQCRFYTIPVQANVFSYQVSCYNVYTVLGGMKSNFYMIDK